MFADYTIVMYQVMFSHDSYKKTTGHSRRPSDHKPAGDSVIEYADQSKEICRIFTVGGGIRSEMNLFRD